MNSEPEFELSADMRLLELQRASLGLQPPERTAWQSRISGDADAVSITQPAPTPAGASAILTVHASASPVGGVIPGAVVTVTLSIVNEGVTPARDVVVSAPIPGGAGFRPGSFVQDGRTMDEEFAERFLHDGLALGEIPAGTRKTFVWKIGVRLGNQPLVIVPNVLATGAAVIGARAVVVGRKERGSGGFAAELERADPALYTRKPLIPVEIPADDLPFYELDTEETIVHEAAEAALSPFVPPQTTTPLDEPLQEPAGSTDAALSDPERDVSFAAVLEPLVERTIEPDLQPEPINEPEPELAPEPEPAVREAVMLYGRFDRATVSFFDKTFNGSKNPTILSHCIFASALACSRDATGEDAFGLKRHLDAQSQILHRIQLHERLGKKEPILEYAGEFLASLDAIRPSPIAHPAAEKDAVVLVTELSEPALAVIAKLNADRERWDFVKARQLTLALQAQSAVGLASQSADTTALDNALRVYAQTAMTALQKLFVRLRIDRSTGVLFHDEPQLDVAARALVSAFANAL